MTEIVSQDSNTSTSTVLPSNIDQVRVVAKYDILKHLRSRRLLGILAIETICWINGNAPIQRSGWYIFLHTVQSSIRSSECGN